MPATAMVKTPARRGLQVGAALLAGVGDGGGGGAGGAVLRRRAGDHGYEYSRSQQLDREHWIMGRMKGCLIGILIRGVTIAEVH
jgi:hypothetical protein